MNAAYSDLVSKTLCLWFSVIGFFITCHQCQNAIPNKMEVSTAASSYECNGVESFEKVNGVELPKVGRIPLFSSTSGAITADCYNRCRSSSSCSAFWIDYNSSECFRLTQPKFIDKKMDIDFTRAAAYFERMCLFGDVCSKAWVAERIPGYELMGYDDVIIRSVISRKRCIELCVTEKRLPCRSADFWGNRKECRLSREDRRSQPGAFVKSASEVDYIENACNEPPQVEERGKDCEWEVMHGAEFKVYDFTTKSANMNDCQRTCETYNAFTCRSVTFDAASGLCLLSGSDTATTSNKLLSPREKKVYAQRVPCVDMSLECHGETMLAKLKSHAPFYGKMFTIPSSPNCEAHGIGELLTSITLPLNTCGVLKEEDGTFATTLLVQQHPLIQKRGDSAFRLVCSFPEGNRTLSKVFGYGTDSPRNGDISAAASDATSPSGTGIGTSVVINSTAKSPFVTLRILDSNGDDVTGVSLGDELFFVVQVEEPSAYGILVRDLIAKSGTKEDELVLLDSRGCPEDPSIFPFLKKEKDSKSLKTRFEAFKFTNDAVVRFQLHLQFCRHECPPVSQNVLTEVKCDGESSYGRRRRDFGEDEDPEERKNNTDLLELRREIIVNSPPTSKSNRRRGHLNDTTKIFSVVEDDLSSKSTNSDSFVCSSKELVIGLIIGFATLQILIVVFSVLCICQMNNKKAVINEPEMNNGGFTLRSPHLPHFTTSSSPLNIRPSTNITAPRMHRRN